MRAPDTPLMLPTRADTLRLVLWVLAVQAVFWGLALVVRPSGPDPAFETHRVSSLALEAADGTSTPLDPRANYYLAEAREATFTGIVEVARPETGLVVFVPRYNRFASLTVNGAAIPASDAPSWRASRLGIKWVVPPQMLVQGPNRLAVHITRECCKAYLAGIIAGPPQALDVPIRQWRMQKVIPSFGLMVLGIFAAIGCVVVSRSPAYRTITLAAALAFTGMALSGLWEIDILTPSSEQVYIAAGQMILLATFAGLVALADRWFPGGPQFDRPLVAASLVFAAVIIACTLASDGLPPQLRNGLESAIVVLANLAVIAAMRRGLKADRRLWTPDAAVLLLVPAISIADLVDAIQINALALNSAPLGILGLAVLLMLGIVRRGQMLSRRLEDANALLDGRIAQKEAELEATAERLRAAEAEAAVQAERSRIMRDMHDGMGGQLLAVLMLSRDEASPRGAITQTVEQAIDDLRLLIDSLDSVGDTLDFALGQFRERAETKLRAAGMRLAWSNRLASGQIILPPGTILTIYRIMQEAINNAVRHSGGSAVSIAITPAEAGGVTIIIADDGKPDPAKWRKGRGLDNMARRAEEMGGSLAIETGPEGTSVTIAIPAP
ncbi:MAG: sensor histidine kinase [Erythrobacter sp.]